MELKQVYELARSTHSFNEFVSIVNETLPFNPQEHEPYFGWCDVKGCDNEGCSGGNAWRDSGYWTVCIKHSQEHREGKPPPQMKQTAINREASRDPKTGFIN